VKSPHPPAAIYSFRIRDGIKVITGDAKGQTKQLCLSDPGASN
jgi:hypothetical protein